MRKMESKSKQVFIRIPAEAEYMDVVRLTLYGIASRVGFGYEEIEDMKVAVSEACNNAILHAYKEGEPGMIDLEFTQTADGLTIQVKDEGASFDYEEKIGRAKPLHNKELDEVELGGLGLYLMQVLMDDLKVNSGQGTEVVLTKYLKQG